jgi:hypothetical protein
MSALVEAIDCVTLPGEPCEEGAAPGHTWMHHLFERVRPTSVLPGRVRFRLDFPGDEILEDCLRRQLSPLDGLSLQSYSPRTRTALVTFDVSKHDVVAVAAAVLRGVGEFARLHGYCDLAHHHHEPASRKTRQAQAKGGHAAGAHGHEHDHEHDHGHDHGHGHGHDTVTVTNTVTVTVTNTNTTTRTRAPTRAATARRATITPRWPQSPGCGARSGTSPSAAACSSTCCGSGCGRGS